MLRQAMHRTLPEETTEIAEIEAASYPADEKATPEGVVMRQKEAGEFFWTLGPMQVPLSSLNDYLLNYGVHLPEQVVTNLFLVLPAGSYLGIY